MSLLLLNCVFQQEMGGSGMVENSTIGLHRDVTFLKGLSEATGVHIIAGAGKA